MNFNLSQLEEKILKFWEKEKIFEKTLLKNKGKKTFIFYEGPPYANGLPGIHHLLARAFKDVILRYRTMKGYYVPRRAGWDTHGLPTEIEVEKILKIRNKKEIEKIGLEKFIRECRKNVFLYKKEWEEFTKRIGFWIDLKNPYITCENSYIESLFWILKKIYQKGLLEKDFRVAPYCPRCQTTLSSHELAQGYKKITEESIYLKFKINDERFENTSFLVWTTTPWTLFGNVALALNPKIKYLLVKNEKENLILSQKSAQKFNLGKKIKEFKGKDLKGISYKPPYQIAKKGRVYETLLADFVSEEEGTGIVHIAPAFGGEDMALIKKENKKTKEKFPILITTGEDGRMKTGSYFANGLWFKKADPKIILDLERRNLLFKKEPFTHDYPFCWRCDTPLMYYATTSFFIRISKIKKKLLKNNEKINWIPSYIKQGRFGKWLEEVKDWNLSRARFWGTPLPIWECKKCGFLKFIGSKRELMRQKFSQNRYFLLRHGESLSNKLNKNSSYPEKFKNHLTEKGKKQIKKIVQKIKKIGIDLIFSSDLLRVRETAEIVGKELKLKVKFAKELREIDFGLLNGKSTSETKNYFDPEGNLSPSAYYFRRFKKSFPKGENLLEVEKRILSFLEKLERKYQKKKILLIGHELPFALLLRRMKGIGKEKFASFRKREKLKVGELKKFEFRRLPFDSEGNFDLHRPFIDKTKFFCPHCGFLMKRVPFVIDCWFDSGAMPFASFSWKGEKKLPKFFPADFIAEGIDQTRGWFYTLLAISTLLGFGPSYRNVISLGLVCDKYGKKMSKSKGNIIYPKEVYQKFGADPARLYFYTLNEEAQMKKFDFQKLLKLYQKFFLKIQNVLNFFFLYGKIPLEKEKPTHPLDKWILSRLYSLSEKIDQNLKKFLVVKSARFLFEFVDDLSNWYLRLSRKRFQNQKKEKDFREANFTLYLTLFEFSKVLAPFVPFFSENIWQNLRRKKDFPSVHLLNWPKNKKLIDQKLEKEMELAKKIAHLALKIRREKKIKVRQPLSQMIVSLPFKISSKIWKIIAREVNVKKISFSKKIPQNFSFVKEGEIRVGLNLKISQKLKLEGAFNQLLREIQDIRKRLGYLPQDKIALALVLPKDLENFVRKKAKLFSSQVQAKKVLFKEGKGFDLEIEKEFLKGKKIKIKIKKL